jgi:sirohydrochlorin ferrochelatase
MSAAPARPSRRTTVLLVGHGSPCLCARRELLELRALLAARTAAAVRLGVLEFPAPPLLPLAAQTVSGLRGRVAVQPLLLFEGLHGLEDVPELSDAVARSGAEVRVGGAFGEERRLVEMAAARLRGRRREGDLLLFVGRGSSRSRALAQTAAVARRVAERAGMDHVVCYTGISRPDLVAGLREAAARGPRRVLALPYLLHTGILARRVEEVLGLVGRHLRVDVEVLPYLGNAPEVVDVLGARLEALVAAR